MNRFVLFLLPFLIVASVFAFQDSSPTLERARQRWERLSPEDQERFRDRYERYRNLSEEDRRALFARAQRMREAKERFRAEISPEVRAKLEHLQPKQREQVLNELAENVARERGARIREKLPQAWVDRLENARPEERARFLMDMQQRAREKAARKAIVRIGRKLDLPAAEVERLQNLPGPERMASVLELGKKLSVKDVAEFGLPPGLTEQQWTEWRALPPNEFFEVVQHHRHEHGWRGPGRAGGEPGDTFKGPPPLPHTLMEALRPTAEEVLRFGDLPAAERRQRLFELRRERVVSALRASSAVDEARLAEIAKMNEAELYKALRKAFPGSPDRRGMRRDGPGGPPRDREGSGGSPHEHDGPGGPPHEHDGSGVPPHGHDGSGVPPHDRDGSGVPPHEHEHEHEHDGPRKPEDCHEPPPDGRREPPPCDPPRAPAPKG